MWLFLPLIKRPTNLAPTTLTHPSTPRLLSLTLPDRKPELNAPRRPPIMGTPADQSTATRSSSLQMQENQPALLDTDGLFDVLLRHHDSEGERKNRPHRRKQSPS